MVRTTAPGVPSPAAAAAESCDHVGGDGVDANASERPSAAPEGGDRVPRRRARPVRAGRADRRGPPLPPRRRPARRGGRGGRDRRGADARPALRPNPLTDRLPAPDSGPGPVAASGARGRAGASAAHPCRLFVFPARDAPLGLVLRRGPSDWFRLSLWHTDTDRLDHGQWMTG